jgi:hypothetical protein
MLVAGIRVDRDAVATLVRILEDECYATAARALSTTHS